ncbi:MAG: response regulator [Longimicrobiaceae bacterium]|jgi:two-component system cell cycle response regulator DivK
MTRKTVLVVEDDPQQRDIVVTFLRHHGYAVLEAADGAAGVDAVSHHRPDMVLMDARLPVMDGWTATARLKSDPGVAAIPVVILTAAALEEDRERSSRAGCDAYLTKPCDPHAVLAEVRLRIGVP